MHDKVMGAAPQVGRNFSHERPDASSSSVPVLRSGSSVFDPLVATVSTIHIVCAASEEEMS